jgi:hypothetical protein
MVRPATWSATHEVSAFMSATPSTRPAAVTLSAPAVLMILAVILFVLGGLGFGIGDLSVTDFGLAVFAMAFLYDLMKR